MKAQIVYDKPCRIRFRCGSNAFTKELERSIHKLAVKQCAYALCYVFKSAVHDKCCAYRCRQNSFSYISLHHKLCKVRFECSVYLLGVILIVADRCQVASSELSYKFDSLAIKADQVWLAGKDADTLIPMSQLQVDDCIRVRTGSVIPVDGQITEGEAYINEASMTGEPLAVMKSAGASVFAGTVVEEGSVVIKVRKLSSDTKISKIIELIDNSENLKAGVQSKAERLADSIVPYSFLAFGLTLLFTRNVTKAVSVLMVDYSCAIKLSTPIAVISALQGKPQFSAFPPRSNPRGLLPFQAQAQRL